MWCSRAGLRAFKELSLESDNAADSDRIDSACWRACHLHWPLDYHGEREVIRSGDYKGGPSVTRGYAERMGYTRCSLAFVTKNRIVVSVHQSTVHRLKHDTLPCCWNTQMVSVR